MLLVLDDKHKADLLFLLDKPESSNFVYCTIFNSVLVVFEFVKIAIEFIKSGSNKKLFVGAASTNLIFQRVF